MAVNCCRIQHRYLAHFSNLRYLALVSCSLKAVGPVALCVRLQYLNLRRNSLSEMSFIEYMDDLRVFIVSENSAIDSGQLIYL